MKSMLFLTFPDFFFKKFGCLQCCYHNCCYCLSGNIIKPRSYRKNWSLTTS